MNLKLKIEIDIPTNMPQPDILKWVTRILHAVNEPGEHVKSSVRIIGPHGELLGEYEK